MPCARLLQGGVILVTGRLPSQALSVVFKIHFQWIYHNMNVFFTGFCAVQRLLPFADGVIFVLLLALLHS
jgi:hypothetical protein